MKNSLKKTLLIFLGVIISLNIFSQTYKGNNKLSFSSLLSSVKYVRMIPSFDDYPDFMINAMIGVKIYLEKMGFELITDDDTYTLPSECDWVTLSFYCELDCISWNNKYFDNIEFDFISCNNDTFEFKSTKRIKYNNFNNAVDFYNAFQDCYGFIKPEYSSINKLKLKRNQLGLTETKIKDNWKKNGIDDIEGIYESTTSNINSNAKYRVCLVKTPAGYNLIYISGATLTADWDEGELKAVLIPTATNYFYKTNWYMLDKSINTDYFITFTKGLMNLVKSDEKDIYIKMYPTATDDIKSKSEKGSGTGFAISSIGYIATCNHVIDGATSITVKGIKGDFSKTYKAKVISTDEKNDLAIIKIDDVTFSTLGTIPYTISSTTSDVGTTIYTLGYPLTSTMGDEIKLTDGVISAKSGYKGDVTSYQISAAAQPGNSGGPLFDKYGNVIGVVNAKYVAAENATYSVKSTYLRNLVDALPTTVKLQTLNSLSGKALTEQVKSIKNFVYIIEVN